MKVSGRLVLKGVLAAAIAAVAIGQFSHEAEARAQAQDDAPRFEVDPFWHEPLEYPFILGSVNGVTVGPNDHIFVVHGGMATLIGRTEAGAATDPVTGTCCAPAPPVIEFDADGSIVRQWGGDGAGYTWPESVNGIEVDPDGNVWIGGVDDEDTRILKFSSDGSFIAEFDGFAGPAGFAFDEAANEAFVADSRNQRVAVIDVDSGEVTRSWGAYGDGTGSGPAEFGMVSCVQRSNDGQIYVCDRTNNRIQVFNADGSFVSEMEVAGDTEEPGSAWEIAFSADPDQQFVYLADGTNHVVHILDRASLEPVGSFGRSGRYPGHFYGVGSIATDSEGNVFTGETFHGKRVQKFQFSGIAPAEAGGQGPAWPASEM